MVKSSDKFVSVFNAGLQQAKRRVQVENTTVNRSVLNLLFKRGYILNYGVLSSRFIEVYQNFAYSRFKLKIFPKSANNFVSNKKLQSLVNSGRVLVVSTPLGYIFSDIALINGLGGALIFEVKFIN